MCQRYISVHGIRCASPLSTHPLPSRRILKHYHSYSETTTIHDDVVIMSATGTAAAVRDSHPRRPRGSRQATATSHSNSSLRKVSHTGTTPHTNAGDGGAGPDDDYPRSSWSRMSSTRKSFDLTVEGGAGAGTGGGARGGAGNRGYIGSDDETPSRGRGGRRGSHTSTPAGSGAVSSAGGGSGGRDEVQQTAGTGGGRLGAEIGEGEGDRGANFGRCFVFLCFFSPVLYQHVSFS